MRVIAPIPLDFLSRAAAGAAAAEEQGYDGVYTTENTHDPFLPLAVGALQTKRVELATAIALAFPRSPMVVANASRDLQVASGGRFSLGLGTQVKGHNERRFSTPWSAPAPRMREYINALRAIWACWEGGEPLNFQGDHYRFDLMPPNFNPGPSELPTVPITVAAVGPAMLRLAGDLADGVRLHPFCTRRYLQRVVMPHLETGLARSGRKREHLEVSGGGFIATGADDEAVAKRVEFVRQRIAFYGSTRSYFPVFEQHDLEDLGHKLHGMSVSGQWRDMPAQISDDVLELFAAIGTHDVIAARIEQRFGGMADVVSESFAPSDTTSLSAELIQDIRRIPCPFKGHALDR